MTISTTDLVQAIPAYMVDIISARILAKPADADVLARGLRDPRRLGVLLDTLPDELTIILLELYWLEGFADWETIAKIHRNELDDFRGRLRRLGEHGLVFQAGIGGRDPLILLPALLPLIKARLEKLGKQAARLPWPAASPPDYWNHVILLNLLQSVPVRCRPELEPFKKGWLLLNEQLGEFMDVGKVYWELANLGCLGEFHGNVRVLTAPAMQLFMADISRYQTWRLLQGCKPYNGLEFRLLEIFETVCLERRLVLLALRLELSSDFDAPDSATADTLIEQWLELGILEQSADGSWLRLNAAVRQALLTGQLRKTGCPYIDEAILQPNMEILVPRDMDPVEHLHIGQVAELKKADIVSIYRLTKGSINRALRNGWSALTIKNLLERVARHQLPGSLTVTVDGWAAKPPAAELIEGTFLFTDTAPGRLPDGLRQIRPGVYLVPPEQKTEIIAQLDQKGIILDGPPADNREQPDWGRELPLSRQERPTNRPHPKNGYYPYGLIKPMPYGNRALEIFETARKEGRAVIIFYPLKGYGEIQARKVRPFSVYSTGGVPFMEAFCEDTGAGEVFNLSKVRGLLDD